MRHGAACLQATNTGCDQGICLGVKCGEIDRCNIGLRQIGNAAFDVDNTNRTFRVIGVSIVGLAFIGGQYRFAIGCKRNHIGQRTHCYLFQKHAIRIEKHDGSIFLFVVDTRHRNRYDAVSCCDAGDAGTVGTYVNLLNRQRIFRVGKIDNIKFFQTSAHGKQTLRAGVVGNDFGQASRIIRVSDRITRFEFQFDGFSCGWCLTIIVADIDGIIRAAVDGHAVGLLQRQYKIFGLLIQVVIHNRNGDGAYGCRVSIQGNCLVGKSDIFCSCGTEFTCF